MEVGNNKQLKKLKKTLPDGVLIYRTEACSKKRSNKGRRAFPIYYPMTGSAMVLSLLPISPPIGKESQSKLETIESQRDGRNQNTNSSFLLGVVLYFSLPLPQTVEPQDYTTGRDRRDKCLMMHKTCFVLPLFHVWGWRQRVASGIDTGK